MTLTDCVTLRLTSTLSGKTPRVPSFQPPPAPQLLPSRSPSMTDEAGKFALRYAGLHEDSESFRDPSGNRQRRHYMAARYTPFRTTSIRVNVETGRLKTLVLRPWPTYDGVTA